MRRLVALLLASTALTGCVDALCSGTACEPCGPALTLRVMRPGGGAVDNVTIEGNVSGTCSVVRTQTMCPLDAYAAGTYEVDVKAPGFQTAHIKQTVSETTPSPTACCDCGYMELALDVMMTPL